MELTTTAKESLNIVRELVKTSTKFTKDEKNHIAVVYESITGKILSLNCDGCLLTAIKILNNYMNLYEPLEVKPIEAVINKVVIKHRRNGKGKTN